MPTSSLLQGDWGKLNMFLLSIRLFSVALISIMPERNLGKKGAYFSLLVIVHHQRKLGRNLEAGPGSRGHGGPWFAQPAFLKT